MREQELKLEQVKKSCNAAKKVAKVFKIIMIVFAVLCFISAIGLFAFKSQINESARLANEINPGTVSIDRMEIQSSVFHFGFDAEQMEADGDFAEAGVIACIMGTVLLSIFAVIFGLIQKIFVTIEEEDSPFTQKVLSTIKKLFIAIAIIIGLEVGIGIGLFLGLFFWCLYCIMDYGFALQKEIDETL